MTNVCRQPGCPCHNPAEDDEPRGLAPSRPPIPGRTMPEGWKQRVLSELSARKRKRTTVEDPSLDGMRKPTGGATW